MPEWSWRSLCRVGIAALAGSASAAARPPQPAAVEHPEALIPWLRAAATGRADVVCIGDSNQLQSNSGWDHGWIKALDERFGLYATGLLTPGEGAGNGAGSGYEYAIGSTVSSGQFQYAGAPPALDLLLAPAAGVVPLNYAYVPAGSVAGPNLQHGLFVERFSGLDINAALRLHAIIGLFPGTPGSFQLVCRQAGPPFNVLAAGPTLSTGALTHSVGIASLDLPPGTREAALNFRYSQVTESITGPFLGYYLRLENRDRAVGTSLHTLYALGGRSARDMAEALFAADVSMLTLYFQQVRALQGPRPRVLVRVNTGLNDRNEEAPSFFTGIVPGDSVEALIENLSAIYFRVRFVWVVNGWPIDELAFLFTVSHPVANPDDPQLTAYRAAVAQFAAQSEGCAAVNLGVLTAWGEMQVNGWYQFGGVDTNHLTEPGYEAIAAREVAALEAGACWRDLTLDRRIDIEDAYEWHRFRPDLTGNGTSDYADLRCLQNAIRADERADMRAPGSPTVD